MQNNIIQQIKTIEWKEWGSRRLTVRLAEHWARCSVMFSKFFNTSFPDQLILIKEEVGRGYFNNIQLNNCLRKILNNLYASSFYDFYEKEAIKEFEEFLNYCKNITNHHLKDYSNNKILDLLDEFLLEEDRFTNYLWVIFVVDDFFSKELESKLKEYLDKKKKIYQYDDFLKILFFPEKKSAIFLQTLDILNVAKDIKNKRINEKEIKEKIGELVNKYSYFTILNFDEKPLGFVHFKNEVDKILKNREINPETEIGKINKQFEDSNEKYNQIIKFLEDDKELVKIAEACHKIAYYRDHRNDIRRESYFYAKILYEEIAKRLKIDLTNILFLTRKELIVSLKKEKLPVSIDVLKERRELSAIALIDKEINFIFNPNSVSDLFEFLEPQITVEEFRGVAASPGKVTGKAKLIFNIGKEGGKLKEGDILVTSMTNLDFIPLMSKASAIVTNEGGLLCHAAIVAREMGKPCIVGTNIATKVLKDGDIIEVHANHGLVKIVKKK